MRNDQDCFGFYSGGPTCAGCVANKRCKAILVTHGFDIAEEVLNHLVTELPKDQKYKLTGRVTDLVDQILLPPTTVTDEERELLELLNRKSSSEVVEF